jgi:hypothetical protein
MRIREQVKGERQPVSNLSKRVDNRRRRRKGVGKREHQRGVPIQDPDAIDPYASVAERIFAWQQGLAQLALCKDA